MSFMKQPEAYLMVKTTFKKPSLIIVNIDLYLKLNI